MRLTLLLSLTMIIGSARGNVEKDERPLDTAYPLRLAVLWNEGNETREQGHATALTVVSAVENHFLALNPRIVVHPIIGRTDIAPREVSKSIASLEGTFDIVATLFIGYDNSKYQGNLGTVCNRSVTHWVQAEFTKDNAVFAARELALLIAPKLGIAEDEVQDDSNFTPACKLMDGDNEFSSCSSTKLQEFIRTFEPGQFCLQGYQLSLKVFVTDGLVEHLAKKKMHDWVQNTLKKATDMFPRLKKKVFLRLNEKKEEEFTEVDEKVELKSTMVKVVEMGKIKEKSLRELVDSVEKADFYVVFKGEQTVNKNLDTLTEKGIDQKNGDRDKLRRTVIVTGSMYTQAAKIVDSLAKKLGAKDSHIPLEDAESGKTSLVSPPRPLSTSTKGVAVFVIRAAGDDLLGMANAVEDTVETVETAVANANLVLSTMQPVLTVKFDRVHQIQLKGEIRKKHLRKRIARDNRINLYVVFKGEETMNDKLQKFLDQGRVCDKDIVKKTLVLSMEEAMKSEGKNLAVAIAKKLGAADKGRKKFARGLLDSSTAMWSYIKKVKSSSANGAICLKYQIPQQTITLD